LDRNGVSKAVHLLEGFHGFTADLVSLGLKLGDDRGDVISGRKLDDDECDKGSDDERGNHEQHAPHYVEKHSCFPSDEK
jgi:hypothetical protein